MAHHQDVQPLWVTKGATGKTYGIIPVCINSAAQESRLVTTVVAESIPAVKAGAVRIFKDVMHDTGRWVEDRWLGNPMQYTFANKHTVEFTSFDSVGKAKAAGKRKRLFINECNHISYDIAHALIVRSEEVWLDYNPDNEFWAHTEVLQEPNSEFLLLTYQDNEAIPAATMEELNIALSKAFHNPQGNPNDPANVKSTFWANWCKVYVFGEIGSLQGTIFDFTICGDVPLEAQLLGYGLDWGYTNDPTTLVALYRAGNNIYVEELIYQTKMRNVDIVARMDELRINKSVPIYCDDAEPKSIADLNNMGYGNAQRANKDHINTSITILQGYNINVTAASLNAIKEFRNYRWDTDKAGKSINKPIKNFNHIIDALRYVGMNTLSAPIGQYSFLD